jgi:valyl-tRNA synthetase
MPDLPPQYNPKDVEEPRYQWWESRGLFQADADPARKPYTIVIPPPNVTGILHMGHALNNTIQDILIRFKRMQGFNALWVPGTDHAGIATQNVVEKSLAKEGKRRQDLGRDAFVQRVWQWREEYGNTILYQLRRLGASCDWRRTRFTMDEGLSNAVLEVFLRLYDEGLIYRGNYIINWCPRCQTALADEEAPRVETQGKLYHIRYPLEGEGERGKGNVKHPARAPFPVPRSPAFVEVATTRPETMLGDTAVAVHPKDRRYKALVGEHVILPIVGRRLPIIADEAVDREFGTGAVKVTPAHDPVDFQLGKKHDLEFINVMTDDARMTNVPKAYEGLDRIECRSKLIVDLEKIGALGAIEERAHNVGHCYRCHTAVEPRLSPQWFVKMQPLAEPAIKAVKKGAITFVPARWTKVYLNWMENIQDWCISRQIWWGHRLPVYYCKNCMERQEAGDGGRGKSSTHAPRPTPHAPGIIVAKSKPAKCPSCGNADLKQDEDVLDTWFSSWLWPFSTLGWPEQTKDLGHFYPTSTLVTAPEIIFFWVARMIMAGYFCMGKPPFTTVYIHGTVRDLTGKKMSKSLGNIIDPLEIINQHGTDALRYTLVTSTAIGTDVYLSEDKFTAGRNFANKLWNAARFILQSVPPGTAGELPPAERLSVFDRSILDSLNAEVAAVTEALDRFDFNAAAERVYGFLWHAFCDWHVEFVKPEIRNSPASQQVLVRVFETSLRLLHPVMPFISEELWQHLTMGQGAGDGGRGKSSARAPRPAPRAPHSIMVAPWPKPDGPRYPEDAKLVGALTQIITQIRSIRSEFKLPPAAEVNASLALDHGRPDGIREAFEAQLKRLARVGRVAWERTIAPAQGMVPFVIEGGKGGVHLQGTIDVEQHRRRIQKELQEQLRPNLQRIETLLKDDAFRAKAPEEILGREEERRRQLLQRTELLEAYLKALG